MRKWGLCLGYAVGLSALVLGGGAARAADTPPATAEVLGKLHGANQKEIEMGKLAQKNGRSKEVKAYGKELVKDHEAADKKVTSLAKKEKIDLAASTPMKSDNMQMVEPGASFDHDFAKAMVDDHRKDIAEVNTARETTTDDQLKKLLTDISPTLQKHLDDAEKIAGEGTMK